MKPRLIARICIAALLTIGAVTSAAPPPTTPAAPSSDPASALPRLVFFMNPNGVPCQIQDKVLREMAAELKGRAEVVYYKTTEQRDLAQFARYGIRSLPLLLVTDPTGREARRAPPGIRSAEEIRRLLGS